MISNAHIYIYIFTPILLLILSGRAGNRLCAFQIVKTLFTIPAEASTVHLVGLPSLSWSMSTFLHPAPQVEFADVDSKQNLLADGTIRLSCNIMVT